MNPSDHVTAFEAVAWEELTPGLRCKTVSSDGLNIRMLDLSAGFADGDWCQNAHHGLVLEGGLNIEMDGGSFEAKVGDAIHIPGGAETKHRATADCNTRPQNFRCVRHNVFLGEPLKIPTRPPRECGPTGL